MTVHAPGSWDGTPAAAGIREGVDPRRPRGTRTTSAGASSQGLPRFPSLTPWPPVASSSYLGGLTDCGAPPGMGRPPGAAVCGCPLVIRAHDTARTVMI